MKRFFKTKLAPQIQKARVFIDKHRIASLLVSGSLLIFIVGWVALWPVLQPSPLVEAPDIIVKKPETKFYSHLTGEPVGSEKASMALVTAIMIENSLEARPQSGIKQAGVVYEAIAEGGITRFVALYQNSKPQLIGPVRSLRPYFVDWIAPYDASIAHVGGSAAALKTVRNGSYRDIDQFFNAGTYWRSSDRYAPHNVYTSFKRLDTLNRQKGYTSSNFTGFEREDGKPIKEPKAKNIKINFSSYQFNTEYRFNAKQNNYTRYLGGKKHLDREKGAITPAVVIAMKVDERHVMEDGYRESIKTTGSGQAIIFQNGDVIEATWKKASRKSPLRLVDKQGKTIKLARGQTWIAAVPNGQGSVSW